MNDPELATLEPESNEVADDGIDLPDEQQTELETETADKSPDPLKKMERRIGRLTQQKYEERARAAQLERELNELRQQLKQPAEQTDQPRVDVEQIVRHVRAHVENEQRQQSTGQRIQSIITEGKKIAENFDELTNSMVDAVGGSLMDQNQQLKPFVEAIIESNQAAQLIAYLGEHDDEAAELASLSKTNQIKRVALLEEKLKQSKPKSSAAPKPLEPVKTSGAGSGPDPSDTEAWIKWRNKNQRGN